jgi:hypothetical protein
MRLNNISSPKKLTLNNLWLGSIKKKLPADGSTYSLNISSTESLSFER